jgi:hypothetical protein
MIFGGTIIISALIEYLVVRSKKISVINFWFLDVPKRLDVNVVLPALAGVIVSGVAQSNLIYGGLATSPKYVVGACHVLSTFGLWWGITDLTSQRTISKLIRRYYDEIADYDEVNKLVDGELLAILKTRLATNLVSCLLVMALYAVMVLKPFGKG